MRTLMLGLFLFSITAQTAAQELDEVTGIYSLSGVMETASGFKFNKDSTFEFYYSYGALDRYGSGTWSLRNNKILLNSKPYPGRDFKLVSKTLSSKKGTTIKLSDKNPTFFRFVYGVLKSPRGNTLVKANSLGEITLPVRTDTIQLVFELAPEKKSTFIVDAKKYNSYVFQFEPWIVEVFFTDFLLTYDGGRFFGKHPLLGDKQCVYKKEK